MIAGQNRQRLKRLDSRGNQETRRGSFGTGAQPTAFDRRGRSRRASALRSGLPDDPQVGGRRWKARLINPDVVDEHRLSAAGIRGRSSSKCCRKVAADGNVENDEESVMDGVRPRVAVYLARR